MTEQESRDNVIEYLKLIRQCTKNNLAGQNYVYAGAADLLLQHGKWYKPQSRPDGFIKLTPKACFANSQYYSQLKNKNLHYVEGYALSIIPVHHAWVVDEDDNVIEVTWDTPGLAYFGLEFKPPKKFKGCMLYDRNLYFKRWKGVECLKQKESNAVSVLSVK